MSSLLVDSLGRPLLLGTALATSIALGAATAPGASLAALGKTAGGGAIGGSSTTPITSNILTTRTSGTAPCGIIFENVALSPAPQLTIMFSDLLTRWAFGESYTFDRLSAEFPFGRDAGTGSGALCTHTYVTPGTYFPSATTYDGVNTPAVKNVSVTIADPDDVFSGSQTVLIGSNSNGAPAGALGPFSTFSAAKAAVASQANQRFLFQRGLTFVNPGISMTQNLDRIQFGAYGTGADPIINITSLTGSGIIINTSCSPIETAIWGLQILGAYDPTNVPTSTNPNSEGIMLGGASTTLSGYTTIHDCRIIGFGKCIWPGGSSSALHEHVYVTNVEMGSWHDYGMICSLGGYIGYAGVSAKQPYGTKNGPGNETAPYYADQGPFRVGNQGGPVCLNRPDFRTLNDWSSDDTNRAFNQAVRVNSGEVDEKFCITEFMIEGNGCNMSANTANPDEMAPIFHYAGRGIVICSEHQKSLLTFDRGGQTYENIVLIIPNNAPGSSTGVRRMIVTDASESIAGNQNRRIRGSNISIIDLRSDANATNRTGTNPRPYNRDDGLSGYSTIILTNLLEYAPNQTGGPTADGPIDMTPTRTDIDYPGERWREEAVNAAMAYGSEVTFIPTPLAGSAAIGTASGYQAIDDLLGNIRPTTGASRGAVEPA